MFRGASTMLSLFLYWELHVVASWPWSWWLKEQEATSALNLIPHLEIVRDRGKVNKKKERI